MFYKQIMTVVIPPSISTKISTLKIIIGASNVKHITQPYEKISQDQPNILTLH